MKNFKRIFLITIIMIYILIGSSFARTGKVTASAVRIRKEMSTESDIITNVYEDDKVQILEESGDWYKIKYNNDIGYAKKEFIKEDKNTVENNTSVNTNNVNNTTEKQNIPNTNTSNNNNQTTNTVPDSNQANSSNSNKATTIVANTLIGIKLNPNFMSLTVAQFEQGKELTKVAEMNNWVKVTDGTVTGWITKVKISEKIENTENTTNTSTPETSDNNKTEENKDEPKNTNIAENKNIHQKGTVNVETANVRKSASDTAERIGFLDYGDTITITGIEGDWYKIIFENATGYVSKKLITVDENKDITSRSLIEERKEETHDEIKKEENKEQSTEQVNSNDSANKGEQVAEYAKQFLGTKYIVGGKNPEVGFDCSGFTRYVYSNFGYNLGTTSSSQSNSGTEVTRENMQVGDLIIFYNEEKSNVGHTAIYIGNGNFVHSANPERGVVIDNLNSNTYYNERFISARKIVD